MKWIAAILAFSFLLIPLVEASIHDESYIEIIKPRNGIYLFDKKIFQLWGRW